MNGFRKISKIQLFYGACAAIAILLILVFITDIIVLPIYTKHNTEVELPDIVEKSVSEADSILSEHGFHMIIDKSEFHPVLPESTVVFQKPDPYTNVKRGRRIYVHISAGEKTIPVPEVIGVSERDARLKLEHAGLTVGEIYYRVSSYPKDVVCSQDIFPNTELPQKSEVSFTVSLGRSKTKYIVPDVVGKQYNEAAVLIKREGLLVGDVKTMIKEDLIPETVLSQRPAAGTEVKPNEKVQLTISQLSQSISVQGDSLEPN